MLATMMMLAGCKENNPIDSSEVITSEQTSLAYIHSVNHLVFGIPQEDYDATVDAFTGVISDDVLIDTNFNESVSSYGAYITDDIFHLSDQKSVDYEAQKTRFGISLYYVDNKETVENILSDILENVAVLDFEKREITGETRVFSSVEYIRKTNAGEPIAYHGKICLLEKDGEQFYVLYGLDHEDDALLTHLVESVSWTNVESELYDVVGDEVSYLGGEITGSNTFFVYQDGDAAFSLEKTPGTVSKREFSGEINEDTLSSAVKDYGQGVVGKTIYQTDANLWVLKEILNADNQVTLLASTASENTLYIVSSVRPNKGEADRTIPKLCTFLDTITLHPVKVEEPTTEASSEAKQGETPAKQTGGGATEAPSTPAVVTETDSSRGIGDGNEEYDFSWD